MYEFSTPSAGITVQFNEETTKNGDLLSGSIRITSHTKVPTEVTDSGRSPRTEYREPPPLVLAKYQLQGLYQILTKLEQLGELA